MGGGIGERGCDFLERREEEIVRDFSTRAGRLQAKRCRRRRRDGDLLLHALGGSPAASLLHKLRLGDGGKKTDVTSAVAVRESRGGGGDAAAAAATFDPP